MDGVLWKDNEAIGNLVKIFDFLSKSSMNYILATNNATKSIYEYVEKLLNFGVKIEKEKIINSAEATGYYLTRLFPAGGSIYVIGSKSLKRTLNDHSFNHSESKNPKKILAVIASLDVNFSYDKLTHATLLIRSGVPLIGTNPDTTYPTPVGLFPGAGTLVRALEIASDTKAVIIGKPQPELYKIAMDRMQTRPEETLVVGDRFETDIVGAQQIGCLSALVLSGVTNLTKAITLSPPPDLVADDLEKLLNHVL